MLGHDSKGRKDIASDQAIVAKKYFTAQSTSLNLNEIKTQN
jgi:hypothetical protein